MYSTCIFCRAPLGANESIEVFPVGRRLAFDAARGRLWVVCRRCARWNLSPLEERWEAVEACERRFRDTRLRVSTENIGLARLPDGLELVRIGRPLRPELAAWRYGAQFTRRLRRQVLLGGAAAAAGAGFAFGGAMLGAIGSLAYAAGMHAFNIYSAYRRGYHVVARLETGAGHRIELCERHTRGAMLLPWGAVGGWSLMVPHREGSVELSGDEAVHAAGLLLPHVNQMGAYRSTVRRAVTELEREGGGEAYFRAAARLLKQSRERGRGRTWELAKAPRPIRLALEMAAHEDTERRALEGELALLEVAWREAEEIAAIADDLVVADSIRQFLRRGGRKAT